MILKSNLKTQIELDFLWTFPCDLGFAAVTCSFIEKVVFNLCLTYGQVLFRLARNCDVWHGKLPTLVMHFLLRDLCISHVIK